MIEQLLALKWWDWQPGKIRRYLPYITKGDLNALIDNSNVEDAGK